MIDGPITQLNQTLDGLRDVIEATQSLKDYIANNLGGAGVPADLHVVIAQHRALRIRSFESDAAAVILYGAMERFVEDLLRGVLRRFARRLLYAELPQQIRQDHLRRSAKLMLNERALARLGETEHLVLEKAWQCQSGANPYELNVGAFTFRDANVRHGVIDELFGRIGCANACSRACGERPFLMWHRTELGRPPSGQVASDLAALTDLVELRNEVAHGAAAASRALSDIIHMIGFVRAFGESLQLVAREHVVLTESDVHAAPLPAPLRIYNHRIVCFELSGPSVKIGDWLIAIDGASVRRCGRIDEIQVSNRPVAAINSAKSAVKVGLRTDMRAKNGWKWRLLTE